MVSIEEMKKLTEELELAITKKEKMIKDLDEHLNISNFDKHTSWIIDEDIDDEDRIIRSSFPELGISQFWFGSEEEFPRKILEFLKEWKDFFEDKDIYRCYCLIEKIYNTKDYPSFSTIYIKELDGEVRKEKIDHKMLEFREEIIKCNEEIDKLFQKLFVIALKYVYEQKRK